MRHPLLPHNTAEQVIGDVFGGVLVMDPGDPGRLIRLGGPGQGSWAYAQAPGGRGLAFMAQGADGTVYLVDDSDIVVMDGASGTVRSRVHDLLPLIRHA